MAQFLFEWTAHVDERKRPENFPKVLILRDIYNLANDNTAKEEYNKATKMLLLNPGLVVLKNPDEIFEAEDNATLLEKRMYVPWHMITYLDGRISPLVVTEKKDESMLEPSGPPEPPKEPLQ